MWPFKRKRLEPTDTNFVDTSRESVPLKDSRDATSLFFNISMDYGHASMTWDDRKGLWEVRVADKGSWTGPTQMEALTAAWTDLGAGRYGTSQGE